MFYNICLVVMLLILQYAVDNCINYRFEVPWHRNRLFLGYLHTTLLFEKTLIDT